MIFETCSYIYLEVVEQNRPILSSDVERDASEPLDEPHKAVSYHSLTQSSDPDYSVLSRRSRLDLWMSW